MSDTSDLARDDTLADTAADGRRTPAADQPAGAGAERYEVEGLLGRGGMGVVNTYYDRRIGRRVACKELRRDISDDGASRARFLREARVQGQLEHPSIVPVYDLGTQPDGAPYFTMRTVRGTTLAEVIAKLASGDNDKRYALHRLLSAFSRVCLTIEYAHERGVLHRDLKPANLILGPYGEVYVLDWGLAKMVGEHEASIDDGTRPSSPDHTHASTLLGTPGYMAPEQIDDAGGVGPATDVYALGAILFELIALEPLHARGIDALESTQRGVEARPSVRTPGRDAPPELEAAIVRATSLDARARGTPHDLAEVIDRYLEGERDLELRRAKSLEHTRAAEHAVSEARTQGPSALDARRRAMQDINRALVLDPANAAAMTAMVELLEQPTDVMPPELSEEAASRFRREMRWVGTVGATVYTALLGFDALFVWMGVRQTGLMVLVTVLMAMSAVLSLTVARSRRPRINMATVSAVTSMASFALATRVISPLLVIPGAVAMNTTGYAVFLPRSRRAIVVVLAVAAFAVPLALELLGLTPPTFAFADGRLQILPVAVDLPVVPTLVLVVVASVAIVLVGSVLMGYIRDRLTDAERRVFIYMWHLRELVPMEVRSRTDPMKRTSTMAAAVQPPD